MKRYGVWRRQRRKPWVAYAFEGEDGKWYIHVQSANGHMTLTGGESFYDQWNAERAVEALCSAYIVSGDSRPRHKEAS